MNSKKDLTMSQKKDKIDIKTLRERLKLTQTEFAQLLGTTQVTISRWESGAHEVSRSYIRIIQQLIKDRENVKKQRKRRPTKFR